MKKKPKGIVFCILAVAAVSFIFGSWALAEGPKPAPDALWEYITETSPYEQWQFWPDHQGLQPGRAPHGELNRVYVNDRAYNSSKPPVQYGSILVKENHNKDEELQAITVMYKVRGYNPNDGDWFWAKYDTEGNADIYGKPKGCIGCHGTRADNDFILVHEFK